MRELRLNAARNRGHGLQIMSHAFGSYGYPITGAGQASFYVEEHVGPAQAAQASRNVSWGVEKSGPISQNSRTNAPTGDARSSMSRKASAPAAG